MSESESNENINREVPPPPPLKCGDYLFMGRRTFLPKEQHQPTLEEMKEKISTEWHSIPIDELVDKLGTNLEKGLTFCHVEHVLSRDGPNKLTPLKEPLRLYHFTRHLRGIILPLMIAVLLCFISATIPDLQPMGSHSMDKVHLGVLLILSTLIVCSFSFLVGRRSRRILESLRDLYPQYAVVIRNGEKWRVRITDVVVGDIVMVKQGDFVPADIRISESTDLETDDSRIIGTSERRPKNPYNVKLDPLETDNLAFFGSYCLKGYGTGVCIATGDRTVLGLTRNLKVALEKDRTAIYNSITCLVKFLATTTGCLGIILFVCSYHVGWFWLDTALYLLILVIANIPDSLLAGTTASLVISAKRMSANNCLVKDLEAVENLGVTTLVCCGKKDVITQNTHTVHFLWLDSKIFAFNPNKEHPEIGGITGSPGWTDFVRAACLCNYWEAHSPFDKLNSVKELSDHSLEQAAMLFLKTCDVDITSYREKYTKVFELPYDPNRNKFHVTIHKEESTSEDRNGSYILSVKGAPDIIMSFCSYILVDGQLKPLDSFYLEAFRQTAEDFLSKGEVVIGYCGIELPESDFPTDLEFQATTIPLKGLRFLGMISIHDPVRPSTVEAIRNFRNAGIKVMLLTGDHPILAKALARQVGIIGENSETRDELAERLHISVADVEPGSVQAVVIYGDELSALKDAELRDLLVAYDEVVVARIAPNQKSRIVKVCQDMNHSVAITGRKFEDTDSLKQADIGIAMANSSCDLCIENANVILLDKSFLTFVTAVKEGRLVFDNLRKSIAYVMTCKFSLILPFFLLLTLHIPLPMGASLILLIFLGTDMFPALSLIYERAENDIMHRTPQFLKEKNVVDLKFIHRLLHKSCCCLGVIISLAGIYTYFIIMAENGFMPQDLLGIREVWYSPAVNDLKDRFNQEWTYSARKDLEYCSQTGFFITVVVMQLFTLVVQKTSRESLLQHGMRNYVLNFSLFCSLILAMICCYVPKLNSFLRTHPLKFIWWLPGIPFGIFIFAYDETRNFIIRHSSADAWIATETY